MAKKPGSGQQVTRIMNENEAPTIYTNHCELGIIGAEFRITFREVLKATQSDLLVREMLRVYFNIHVARQLAKMLDTAVKEWDAALPSAKSGLEPPA